mmetsp:Transcript_18020/g.20789  ORF Transcript_18020/g.20789 Transcript_18020/m.20789 type:complete len:264 (-) Transcript_18020:11-802(-)
MVHCANKTEDSFGSNISIPPKELKELKRVFENLCFKADKSGIIEQIRTIDERIIELERGRNLANPRADLTNINVETAQLSSEKEKLEKELDEIKDRPDQHIRPQDTGAALKALGRKAIKREVMDMMWEVDEKVDGVIDWEEFHLMFERNVRDTTGLEPASFYQMTQFMIYDRDNNGMVSIDETMNMLYARIGREKMENTITLLFGGIDGAPIQEEGQQGGEIDFSRYLEVVSKEQRKMFNESELGLNLIERKKGKAGASRKSK